MLDERNGSNWRARARRNRPAGAECDVINATASGDGAKAGSGEVLKWNVGRIPPEATGESPSMCYTAARERRGVRQLGRSEFCLGIPNSYMEGSAELLSSGAIQMLSCCSTNC